MIGVGRRGCIALCQRRFRAVDAYRGKAVEADGLDQRADVRLRMRQPQRHAARAQALREAREVDHQRRVRERQPGQIHDHVTRRGQGRGERTAAAAARRPVLIPLDSEDGELCVEADDGWTLQRTVRFVQVTAADFPTLGRR